MAISTPRITRNNTKDPGDLNIGKQNNNTINESQTGNPLNFCIFSGVNLNPRTSKAPSNRKYKVKPTKNGVPISFTKKMSNEPAPLIDHWMITTCIIPVIKHPVRKAQNIPHLVTLYLLK